MYTLRLFSDPEFRQGFLVHGPNHGDGYVGAILPWRSIDRLCFERIRASAKMACRAVASRHELSSGKIKSDATGYEARTETQLLRVDYTEHGSILRLSLDASGEYDSPRRAGEAWPHLLVEQTTLGERCPTLDRVTALKLRVRSRILGCKCHMDSPDPSLHCAQTTLFFTVSDSAHNDMWWFGVPIFDNREYVRAEYMALDLGKDDCTGKFIYTAAQTEFTSRSFHSFGDWIDYDRDILPLIARGICEAKRRGYTKSDSLSDCRLTTMNLGWEITGTYSAAMEISRLSLEAVIGD